MSRRPTAAQTDDLRRLLQRLFRRFGALGTDGTPCGKPLSMAHAHGLMVLLAKGELSQQHLGAELCIDKSNVARLCAKMAEAGHATQRQCAKDGRSRRVALTSRGKRLAREVEAASGARFRSLLTEVPPDRRPQVLEALEVFVSALDALPPALSNERNSA
jgi:DNA-binding MarR family transcriptional regulator